MNMNKIVSFITVFMVVFFVPGLVLADSRGLGPQESVQHLLGEIRQITSAKNRPMDPENQKHSQSALNVLNVSEISKKTLGKHWAKRSDSEQKNFQALLGELFIHVAFPSSAKFFAELDLVYGKIKEEKQKVIVPITVVHEKEGEVGIDFHMIQTEGKWQVVDVILDGVSMRNNLRSQFYKVISKKGFNQLIQSMEEKLKASH